MIDGVAIMGKMKYVAKGTNDIAAMDLAAAEEKLVNPHSKFITVRHCLSIHACFKNISTLNNSF